MSKHIVTAIVLAAAGFALGVFAGPVFEEFSQSQSLSAYERQTGFSFERCAGLAEREMQACADQLLLDDAVRKQDDRVCETIADGSLQQDCRARVDRLIRLGQAASWCAGISNDPFCEDLAKLMLASERKDLRHCQGIMQAELSEACFAMLNGTATANANGARRVVSEFMFGYQCDEGVEQCVLDKSVFRQAVLGMDTGLCDNFTFDPAVCVQEVHTYRAYNGTPAACGEAPNPEKCQFDVAVAKALDGDTSACSALGGAADGCLTISSTLKEKRFEYLQ